MKLLFRHLPLFGVLLIYGIIELIESGSLPQFRNESTYGWMVVVWYPLASLLALTQVIIWVAWIVGRLRRNRKWGLKAPNVDEDECDTKSPKQE